MDVVIPAIFLAVLCAIGLWYWWSVRKGGISHTSYKSRGIVEQQQQPAVYRTVQVIAQTPQKKDDPISKPLYDGEPLKVTPLGGGRKRELTDTHPPSSGIIDRVERPPRELANPSPYTMHVGDVALAFCVGNRYYDSSKKRVFECIALKGKKARRVAFGILDSIKEDTDFLRENPELAWFKKVRIDNGVETCRRGALRADRQATEDEVAAEFDLLRRFRKSVAEYIPSGSGRVSITIGDKTYTS